MSQFALVTHNLQLNDNTTSDTCRTRNKQHEDKLMDKRSATALHTRYDYDHNNVNQDLNTVLSPQSNGEHQPWGTAADSKLAQYKPSANTRCRCQEEISSRHGSDRCRSAEKTCPNAQTSSVSLSTMHAFLPKRHASNPRSRING